MTRISPQFPYCKYANAKSDATNAKGDPTSPLLAVHGSRNDFHLRTVVGQKCDIREAMNSFPEVLSRLIQ